MPTLQLMGVSDGKRQRVEDLLGDFVLEMESVGRARKKQHEEREADRKRREEIMRIRKIEEARIENLQELVQRHDFVHRARLLIDSVRKAQATNAKENAEWVSWAEAYINSIDPLKDGAPAFIDDILEERSYW